MENDTIYKTNQPTDQQINMTNNSQLYMYICMMYSRDHRGSITNVPIDQQINMTNNRPPHMYTYMTYSRDHRGITTNPPIDQQTNMTSKNRLNSKYIHDVDVLSRLPWNMNSLTRYPIVMVTAPAS